MVSLGLVNIHLNIEIRSKNQHDLRRKPIVLGPDKILKRQEIAEEDQAEDDSSLYKWKGILLTFNFYLL